MYEDTRVRVYAETRARLYEDTRVLAYATSTGVRRVFCAVPTGNHEPGTVGAPCAVERNWYEPIDPDVARIDLIR